MKKNSKKPGQTRTAKEITDKLLPPLKSSDFPKDLKDIKNILISLNGAYVDIVKYIEGGTQSKFKHANFHRRSSNV